MSHGLHPNATQATTGGNDQSISPARSEKPVAGAYNASDETSSSHSRIDNHYSQGNRLQPALTPGGTVANDAQMAFPNYHRKFGNPAPLGLISFACTTFLLSLFNVGTRGLGPNVAVACAVGFGGFTQLLAGMWDFAAGNTFGATAFTSYGLFWFGYAMILIPFFGITGNYYTGPGNTPFPGAYGAGNQDPTHLPAAVGCFLATWFIITTLLLIASARASIALFILFFLLDMTFLLLFAAEFSGVARVGTAGGGFGLATAMVAFYIATAGLLTPEDSYFTLPVGPLSKK